MTSGRRGHTLLEALVTLTVLGATLAIVAQGARAIGRQQRSLDEAQQALAEAENLLERITQLAYDELTVEAAQQLAGNDAPRWDIAVDSLSGPPPAKRVSVRRLDDQQPPRRPVALSAWVFAGVPSAIRDGKEAVK